MTRVYKYEVPINDKTQVMMPAGAQILYVSAQYDAPCIWARIDPAAPLEARQFRFAGTGHDLDDDRVGKHVGSFQMRGGALVFHLFEMQG